MSPQSWYPPLTLRPSTNHCRGIIILFCERALNEYWLNLIKNRTSWENSLKAQIEWYSILRRVYLLRDGRISEVPQLPLESPGWPHPSPSPWRGITTRHCSLGKYVWPKDRWGLTAVTPFMKKEDWNGCKISRCHVYNTRWETTSHTQEQMRTKAHLHTQSSLRNEGNTDTKYLPVKTLTHIFLKENQ